MSKRKRSAEERQRLLAEHRTSGMTRQQFSEHHRIPLTTLDSWKRAERKSVKQRLVAVKIHPTPVDATAQSFTLHLANGRRVECNWNFPEKDLARLIRAVESA